MAATIRLTQDNGIGRMVFDNSSRHNALGDAELTAIEQALAQLEPSTRVLMIHAKDGNTFCAGADLAQIQSGVLSGERFQVVTNQIAALPIPSIALINGNVFGGGVELAMSCDFRIGVTGTTMRIPAAAFGLCYPPEGIRRMVSRLGITTAKRILVAAETLSADDMFGLGVVDRLVPSAEALARGEALAAELASLAPLAVGSMLSVIRDIETGHFDAEKADALAAMCAASEDLREGLAARQARRLPAFRGC